MAGSTDHPMQQPLWALEWAIVYAEERADRADDEAAKAWEHVAELRRQRDEMLKGLVA